MKCVCQVDRLMPVNFPKKCKKIQGSQNLLQFFLIFAAFHIMSAKKVRRRISKRSSYYKTFAFMKDYWTSFGIFLAVLNIFIYFDVQFFLLRHSETFHSVLNFVSSSDYLLENPVSVFGVVL